MKVLGLDLSMRATGTCILDGDPGDGDPKVRTRLISQPEAKTVESRLLRLVSISEHIIELIENEKPDHVIIEAAAKNQMWQAAAMGEVHGSVKVQIYLATGKIPMVKEASEIRKAVIGKIDRKVVTSINGHGLVQKRMSYGEVDSKIKGKTRRATIKDIIEARLRERGLEFPTQDEMDAYVTAKFCWDKVAPLPKR